LDRSGAGGRGKGLRADHSFAGEHSFLEHCSGNVRHASLERQCALLFEKRIGCERVAGQSRVVRAAEAGHDAVREYSGGNTCRGAGHELKQLHRPRAGFNHASHDGKWRIAARDSVHARVGKRGQSESRLDFAWINRRSDAAIKQRGLAEIQRQQ
jgi:hypothetical protein